MNKRLVLFLTTFAIVTGVILFTPGSGNQYNKIPRGMGTEEDPNARSNFEWMKLRDPKTNEIPDNIRQKELEFIKSIKSKNQILRSTSYKPTSEEWNWMGPANISGRTRAFRFDITNNDENTILAGGIASGVWKSTDGGDTWVKKTRLDQLQSVSCIAQDPRPGFGNIWYYGTGEKTGGSAGAQGGSAAYSGNGVFKSTDNGETWELLESTASNTPQVWDNSFDYVWEIAVDKNGYVYAACSGETFRSTDGGNTWTTILADGFSGNYSDFVITTTGVYYSAYSSDAEENTGVWKSTDGENFTDITPDNFPQVYDRIEMAVAPSNENVLYLVADLGDKVHAFWKYTDGVGWEDRSQNLELTYESDKPFDSQGGYDLVVSVKPNDENFVVLGGVDLWRSTDGFATTNDNRRIGGTGFVTLDYPNHFPDHHVIRFLPSNPNVMFVANDGGIYKTIDVTDNSADAVGVTVEWSFVSSKAYNTTLFFGIDIDKATAGSEMIAGGMQDRGNFRRANGSNDWPEVSGGDGMMSAVADGGAWFVSSTQLGSISRYSGPNFISETWMKPFQASGQLWVTPYYLDPSDNEVMYYAAGEYLWRNNQVTIADDETGWEQMNNSAHSGETITAIGVSKNNSSHQVYYGTDNGKIYKISNANTGDPVPAVLPTPGQGSYLSSLYVDPENSDRVILAYSNYNVISIYHSTDGGNSWENISGNLEQNSDGSGNGPSVRWATFLNNNGSFIYFAGTSAGLFSTNILNGESTQWVKEGNNSIGNSVVVMMIPREVDDYLAVATHGAGVFSASFSGTATNTEPTLTLEPGGPYMVEEGSQLSITLVGTDSDEGSTLTYSSSNLPDGSTLNANTGVFLWTPGTEQSGSYNVVFTVTDNQGASASKTAEITVTDLPAENNPPTIALDPTGPYTIAEENTLSITLVGSDEDEGSVLIYSSANLPSGSTLDANSGAFNWTPASGQAGSYNVVFIVTDEQGAAASASAAISVIEAHDENNPPTLTLNPEGPYNIAEDEMLMIILVGNDVDAASVLTYSASGMPDGALLDASAGNFSWTPGFDDAGSVEIIFTVTDNFGAASSATASINIANTNREPVFTDTMPAQELQVFDPPEEFSFQYKGTDPDDDQVTFELEIGPEGSSVTQDGLFTWSPSSDQTDGYFDIVVLITDGDYYIADSTVLTTSSTITGINGSLIPEMYSLKQNYPNPFNPSSTISYAVPVESNVQIEIYDITGTLMKSFKMYSQPSGYYNLTWNGTNEGGIQVASGTYIYRMKAESLNGSKEQYVQSYKMILMK